MDKPISALIVGDETSENAALANQIGGYEELRVTGIAEDSETALRLLRERSPEAVILDLGKDVNAGIGLLRELRKPGLSTSPYMLVLASTPVSCEIAWDYGANFVVEKGQRGYSAKFIADFLTVIQNQLRRRISMNTVPAESAEQRRKRLTTRIRTELNRVGVSMKLSGYRYLTIAIRIMVETATTSLYHEIAAEVGKSSACVERAMRNALVLAWSKGDSELLGNYPAKLASGRTVPTVREFVSVYAGKLRLEFE